MKQTTYGHPRPCSNCENQLQLWEWTTLMLFQSTRHQLTTPTWEASSEHHPAELHQTQKSQKTKMNCHLQTRSSREDCSTRIDNQNNIPKNVPWSSTLSGYKIILVHMVSQNQNSVYPFSSIGSEHCSIMKDFRKIMEMISPASKGKIKADSDVPHQLNHFSNVHRWC